MQAAGLSPLRHLAAILRWPSASGLGLKAIFTWVLKEKQTLFYSIWRASAFARCILKTAVNRIHAKFLCVFVRWCEADWCCNTRWFLPRHERWKYQTTQLRWNRQATGHRRPLLCGSRSATPFVSVCMQQTNMNPLEQKLHLKLHYSQYIYYYDCERRGS